jgi:hypothetical protein
LFGCGVVFVLLDVCKVELCTAHRRLLTSVLRVRMWLKCPRNNSDCSAIKSTRN